MADFKFKDESYYLIGLCMDIQNELGKKFSESVYGDALEIELKSHGVPFESEVKFKIEYK